MTPEQEKRLRDVETRLTTHNAQWHEQHRANDVFRERHDGHYRHIKELRTDMSACLKDGDMKTIEKKVDDISASTQMLREDFAERRGRDNAWRWAMAVVATIYTLVQIYQTISS